MTTDQLEQQMKIVTEQIGKALDDAGIKGSVLSATCMHHLALSVLLGAIGPDKTREILQLSMQTIDEVYGQQDAFDMLFAKMKTTAVH